MKRPALAVCIALVAALLALAIPPAAAHDDDLGPGASRMSVDGAWRLVSPGLAPGETEYKLVAGGRFAWYVVADGKMIRGAEGRAGRDGETYFERIDSAISDDYAWMIGAEGRFTAELEGGRWRHRGIVRHGERRVEVDELWERVR